MELITLEQATAMSKDDIKAFLKGCTTKQRDEYYKAPIEERTALLVKYSTGIVDDEPQEPQEPELDKDVKKILEKVEIFDNIKTGKYNRVCAGKLTLFTVEITKDFTLTDKMLKDGGFMKKFKRALEIGLVCKG